MRILFESPERAIHYGTISVYRMPSFYWLQENTASNPKMQDSSMCHGTELSSARVRLTEKGPGIYRKGFSPRDLCVKDSE